MSSVDRRKRLGLTEEPPPGWYLEQYLRHKAEHDKSVEKTYREIGERLAARKKAQGKQA